MTDTTVIEEQTLNRAIVTWVRGKLGQQVGDGECWTLVNDALNEKGAKDSYDFGAVSKTADYVWGTEITDFKTLQPGDILQFKDFVEHDATVVDITFKDGGGFVEGDADAPVPTKRPHHSAIVNSSPDGEGRIEILEQNFGSIGKKVQKNTIHTKDLIKPTETTNETHYNEDSKKNEVATVKRTVKITITGTLKAYRPVKKPEERE